ncbi:hypothetical protein PTTG_29420, partial [Puccinia triticina 1-1 BBBD Race 1]
VFYDVFVEERGKLPIYNKSLSAFNTDCLVQCTHTICSRSLKETDIHGLEAIYIYYSKSMSDLFPEANIQPSHHSALRIPEHLRKGPGDLCYLFQSLRARGVLAPHLKIRTTQIGSFLRQDEDNARVTILKPDNCIYTE